MSDKLSPMQEQLLGQASSILQSVSDTVSKATDLAAAQLPDIAMQYVAYGRVSNTLTVLLAVAMIALTSWIVVVVCFLNKYKMRETEGRMFIGFLTTAFMGVPSVIVFCHNISEMIMVWMAPKVWLIKELVNLVK